MHKNVFFPAPGPINWPASRCDPLVKDLITKLLKVNPEKRLGFKNGAKVSEWE